MNEYFPSVMQAVAGEKRFVYAYFTDGSIHKFDVQPLISPDNVFAPLIQDDFFQNRITVMHDTVAWDVSGHFDHETCIDLDPLVLYQSERVSDPLENVG